MKWFKVKAKILLAELRNGHFDKRGLFNISETACLTIKQIILFSINFFSAINILEIKCRQVLQLKYLRIICLVLIFIYRIVITNIKELKIIHNVYIKLFSVNLIVNKVFLYSNFSILFIFMTFQLCYKLERLFTQMLFPSTLHCARGRSRKNSIPYTTASISFAP